jgi:NAD(P)-dependent dehydrogenase (short-subunit alcohol dehydrogenase family)
LGRGTAEALARAGGTVVAAARDPQKGRAAVAAIRAATGNDRVELLSLDLASLASVRAAAAEFKRRYDRLNVLVNNAGVFLNERQVTPDGLEWMFAANHLGPFLLTNLLMDSLAAGAPARVINVTAPSTVRPDFDDLQGERRFSAAMAFGASKAANLLFTYALARRARDRGIVAFAYHPGIVRTGLMRRARGPFGWFSGLINRTGQTPEQAGAGLAQAALDPGTQTQTGHFIHRGRPIASRFEADVEAQERLWQASERLAGLETSEPQSGADQHR